VTLFGDWKLLDEVIPTTGVFCIGGRDLGAAVHVLRSVPVSRSAEEQKAAEEEHD
jgi:hypothetical protein